MFDEFSIAPTVEHYACMVDILSRAGKLHEVKEFIESALSRARRYIISFNASTTLVVEGMEFVKCEVGGQSFMLHQIREMIGMTVAIMRNCVLDKALQQ